MTQPAGGRHLFRRAVFLVLRPEPGKDAPTRATPPKRLSLSRSYRDREDPSVRSAIVIWIERTYHRRRRQRRLGRLTPIEFELLHDQPATAA